MIPARTILAGLAAALLATTALAAHGPRAGAIVFKAAPGDPAAADTQAFIPVAKARVEHFFGKPFAEPVRVTLVPDRAAFNAAFPKAWGMDKTECWMVGVGVADFLALLSPAHRPVQTTKDLPGFWRGSWKDVRTEMKGRYPRHVWPEDPAAAAPVTRAKPRGT